MNKWINRGKCSSCSETLRTSESYVDPKDLILKARACCPNKKCKFAFLSMILNLEDEQNRLSLGC
jgi:hypothetical protein